MTLTSPLPSFRTIYEALAVSSPQAKWWPAESEFEIVIGAVLTQNVAWRNVEYAITALREGGHLHPEGILALEHAHLAELIRPAGYMNVKARYLHNVTSWFQANHALASSLGDEALRASLLAVKGVGPETADDILLYVYRRPAFIWDLYARRLLTHLGFEVPSTYEAARRALSEHVEAAAFSVEELAVFHGLIVDAGKLAQAEGSYNAVLESLKGRS
ncbi:endonuclease III domain-containing protein [Schaalia sp. Marseille-Q2122]|uniref:endonuclease III domain-containing protein n=1 Tax=Schaalia sp. Marseille-Q2122 TaxID=2736604 RepID=UPI00158EA712|nr:deoxyribonuclease [Schaalia sp. Marseille-Q2122]